MFQGSYLPNVADVTKRLRKKKDEKRPTSRFDSEKVTVTNQESRGG